jgi:hypothetical protein
VADVDVAASLSRKIGKPIIASRSREVVKPNVQTANPFARIATSAKV